MIDVILMEPEHPGNLGAVARAVKNFGIAGFVLVDPKADRDAEEAINRAKWAKDILKAAKVIKKEELGAYDYLISTSAKMGTDYNIPRSPLDPSQLAKKIVRKPMQRKKIGILFGRESSGLTNEEIGMCDFLVSIPGHKGYPVFNLSHAVAIILYELFKESQKESSVSHIRMLSGKEKNILIGHVDAAIRALDFKPKEKAETQKKAWKHVIGKAMLTRREGFALMGFFRKIR
ncbi:MAG: RNA methyltransferase [DPANN group archaeon]|nr:RNA methyltransferase [DPANN group archaeon]